MRKAKRDTSLAFRAAQKRAPGKQLRMTALGAGCGLLQDALHDGFEVVRGQQILFLE